MLRLWRESFGQGECEHCNNLNVDEDRPTCDVVEGTEDAHECPAWQDFVHFNGIRIYK